MADLTPLFGAALGGPRPKLQEGAPREVDQEDAWMSWAAQYMPDMFNRWLELSRVGPNQDSGLYFQGQDIAKSMQEAFKDFKIKEGQSKNAFSGPATSSVWKPTWVTGPDGQMYYAATAEAYNQLMQKFNQESRRNAAMPGNPGASSGGGSYSSGGPSLGQRSSDYRSQYYPYTSKLPPPGGMFGR